MKSLFEFLRGTLVNKNPASVVVEVNGVGFLLKVSANTAAALPNVGEEAFLYTHLYVREDALVLFGFASPLERTVFTSLLGVEGIGPRTALAVLSTYSASEVLYLVRAGDVASLVRVNGIGKKTAQRIILELKEKLGGLISDEETAYENKVPEDDLARAALLELGYRPEEVQAALSRVARDLEPAARVRAALEVLRKR
ncbi:MAG: holliday junction helicase RuvA [Bacillota bacterium]|nr:holliday junction helicase RuvA [Bacillota bacterium]MDK2925708.1 holliday junction helicase RuvA [Bacillota bacterium]MDK2959999.1 holliday junction helicase RuvA [Bacillota bacterium]